MLINKSALYTAKDAKIAKQEGFFRTDVCAACLFKSASICVYLRFRKAKTCYFDRNPGASTRFIPVHHDAKDLLAKRICLNTKANKKYHDKMMNKMVTLDKVLQETEHLEFDDREFLLNILSKRQIELRRVEISKRVKEALKAYKEGNVKSGNLDELWKDLND